MTTTMNPYTCGTCGHQSWTESDRCPACHVSRDADPIAAESADGCYFYAVEASFTTTRRLTPEQLEAIVCAITAQLDEPTDDDGEVIDAGISNVEGMVVTEGDRID